MDDRSGIIQLDQVRSKKLEEKKRRTERIFFNELMGVYGVSKTETLIPIELVDVSEAGLGFQVRHKENISWPVDLSDQKIRLYFSPESFMEVVVDVRNSRPVIEHGIRMIRFGAEVQEGQKAFKAWSQFVGFLRTYAEVSQRDTGNTGVSSF
jgi:hypothetical protein